MEVNNDLQSKHPTLFKGQFVHSGFLGTLTDSLGILFSNASGIFIVMLLDPPTSLESKIGLNPSTAQDGA